MIRFENDPEKATAPAVVVDITQTLDPDLDWTTFRLEDLGFGDVVIDVPPDTAFFETRYDATATLGVFVDIEAGINAATGEIHWQFVAIDPETGDLPEDPFVGFLPPNVNGPDGEGFVTYSIRPKAGRQTGDRVDALASIVFDVNEPILTPPIFNTFDVAPPASSVEPLPDVTNEPTFLLSWSGADDADGTPGSGIESFDIYVSTNSGPFTLWLDDTPANSAEFVGENGSTYAFYSVARDLVGHVETPPTVADSITTVATNRPPIVAKPIEPLTVDEDSPTNVLELTNVFSDPDAGDVLTISLFGNSNPSLVASNLSGTTLSLDYLPNQHGVAILTLRATDAAGEFVETSFTVTVTAVNDPPLAGAGSASVAEDAYVDVDLRTLVSDVETPPHELQFAISAGSTGRAVLLADGHTARFTASAVSEGARSDSFHYTVTDTGDGTSGPLSASASVQIQITPAIVVGNSLSFSGPDSAGVVRVGGTDRADVIVLSERFGRLYVNLNNTGIPIANVTEVRVWGRAGNDVITSLLSRRSFLHGGEGNDLITGGPANNIMLGGSGNDILLGGAGDDFLLGGAATDLILGLSGNDILAGGDLDSRTTRAEIDTIIELWSDRRISEEEEEVIAELFIDDDFDQFTGNSGADWFIAKNGDRANDVKERDSDWATWL